MNQICKQIADTLAKGMQSAVEKVVQFAKECQEQENNLAAQRVAAMREAQATMQKMGLQPEYERLASAVVCCLASEHEICGLKRPRNFEDIMCDNENNNIRINGTAAPDFSYEAKRDYSNCGTLSDILNGRNQSVSVTDIEKLLNRSLRKYSARRGYTFSRVTVDDIPQGKVRITAHDVGLTPEEQLRRNGCGY